MNALIYLGLAFVVGLLVGGLIGAWVTERAHDYRDSFRERTDTQYDLLP